VIGEIPLVAIGGITESDCRSVLDAGADSVAMISSIVSDPANITSQMGKLVRALSY